MNFIYFLSTKQIGTTFPLKLLKITKLGLEWKYNYREAQTFSKHQAVTSMVITRGVNVRHALIIFIITGPPLINAYTVQRGHQCAVSGTMVRWCDLTDIQMCWCTLFLLLFRASRYIHSCGEICFSVSLFQIDWCEGFQYDDMWYSISLLLNMICLHWAYAFIH